MQVSLLVALALAADPAAPVETSSSPPSAAAREWPGFGFDRVDLLSETATWLNYDALVLRSDLTKPSLRFVEQLKVSFRLPWRGFYAGISIAAQDLTYEHPLGFAGLYVTGGIQTRLLFPDGLHAGVAWRWKMLRIGASVSAFTSGSWSVLTSGQATAATLLRPQVLPTLGIGIGAAEP